MMTTVLLFGFLIGLRHALEADHVAAVASLATRSRDLGQSVRLGAAWGLGHSLTLLAVGGLVLISGKALPPGVTLWLEVLVGAMLIMLGADVLRRMIRERVHFHSHRHGEMEHFHSHSHAGEGDHGVSPHAHDHGAALSLRALIVGLMHGLAGSAALVLLTAQAIESIWQGVVYMALFGLGSTAGMALLSCAISLPLRYAARNLTWAYNGLGAVMGLFTAGLGLRIILTSPLM
jgi:ABC-type nickel/cobalt efflux system permease component RcnA